MSDCPYPLTEPSAHRALAEAKGLDNHLSCGMSSSHPTVWGAKTPQHAQSSFSEWRASKWGPKHASVAMYTSKSSMLHASGPSRRAHHERCASATLSKLHESTWRVDGRHSPSMRQVYGQRAIRKGGQSSFPDLVELGVNRPTLVDSASTLAFVKPTPIEIAASSSVPGRIWPKSD